LFNRPFATVLILPAGKVCHAVSSSDGISRITEALEYRETYSLRQGYSCSLAEMIKQSDRSSSQVDRGIPNEETCSGSSSFGPYAVELSRLGAGHQSRPGQSGCRCSS
jgi:hypothetical protein